MPELGRDHVLDVQDPEVLGHQRMLVHRGANLDRELDRLHDQPVALQLHLPARHVERRDDLLVGRRRGVREHRLLEGLLVQVVVLVGHQHHRALPQRRHRLVRRVRLVDAQLGLARIGYEPRVEHARVLGVEVRAERLLLREVALQVRGIGEGLLQVRARAHRRARAVERREAGEAEPGLVPEEDRGRA